MTKRGKARLLAGGLGVIAIVIAFFALDGGVIRKEITSEEAQARLSAALAKRALEDKRVVVDAATVRFADDKVIVDAKIRGSVLTRQIQADVHTEGTLTYRKGAFYFSPDEPPDFTNVQVEKKPDSAFAKTKKLLGKKAESFFAEHGMEDLPETLRTDFREWIVSVAERSVTAALERYPVYTIKNDFKGVTIKAALENVHVVNDRLVITFSLWQLGFSILFAALTLLVALGIAVALLMSPGWGTAVIVLGTFGD